MTPAFALGSLPQRNRGGLHGPDIHRRPRRRRRSCSSSASSSGRRRSASFPFTSADDAQSAAIQLALNQNLTPTGTGTYIIPGARRPRRAPIALRAGADRDRLFQHAAAISPDDMSMLLPGFILALVAGPADGLRPRRGRRRRAQLRQRRRGWSSSSRSASRVWEYLATPVFNHFGWRYWIYAFIAESVSLILAGLVIARWFLPRAHERRRGRARRRRAGGQTRRPQARARRGSGRRRRSRGGDWRAPPRPRASSPHCSACHCSSSVAAAQAGSSADRAFGERQRDRAASRRR